MKDLFQNYHKHKVLSNVGILSLSAILAVSVNMFVLSGNTGEALKANVLEATVNKVQEVDFRVDNTEDALSFSNSQEMKNVTELSFALAYNYEILTLGESSSDLDISDISVIENNDGFSSYIVSFTSPQNIPKNTNLVHVDYSKSSEETVHLNVINVNFKDSEDQSYLLSTQGIIF